MSDEITPGELRRTIDWLKSRIKNLEARCSSMERIAHESVDLRPLIISEIEKRIPSPPTT